MTKIEVDEVDGDRREDNFIKKIPFMNNAKVGVVDESGSSINKTLNSS